MSDLDIGSVVTLVLTDELTAGLATHWQMVFNESEATVCILLVSKE
jgi:hypothetical protein